MQIQQQMMMKMTRKNVTKVGPTTPPSISKTPTIHETHPTPEITASKFIKKSSLKFSKYAGDEDLVDWIGNAEHYFRFRAITVKDRVTIVVFHLKGRASKQLSGALMPIC